MREEEDNNRQKAAALLFVVLAAFGVVLAMSSGSVMAATGFNIQDDTLTTDNGAVTGLEVSVNGEITWDGAEHEPGETDVRLQVKNPDGSWETLEETTYADLTGLAGTESYSFSNVDVTQSDWNNGDFNAAGDGSDEVTDVEFRLQVETSGNLDGEDNRNNFVFNSSSDTATITVTNEANSNSASGNGNTNAQGNNQEP